MVGGTAGHTRRAPSRIAQGSLSHLTETKTPLAVGIPPSRRLTADITGFRCSSCYGREGVPVT